METLNINEKGYKERYSQIMDKSEMKTQETKHYLNLGIR